MQTLRQFIVSMGGMAQTRELYGWGATSHGLTRAVRANLVYRARQGWYALPDSGEDIVRAVRVGGRLTGVSAAAFYGLAVPENPPLHVDVPWTASRLRSQSDRHRRLSDTHERTVVHWGNTARPTPATRFVVSVLDCLYRVLVDESEDDAVACLDSAIHTGQVDLIDLELLRRRLPEPLKYLIDVADGRSDGYPESVARRKLARAGIATQIQVPVLGERRIDLLIGDRLALEVNGVGKYLQDLSPGEVARRIEADQQRDAFLEALGFHVIRISYYMVVHDWDATLSMILAVMARGDHLHRPAARP